MEGAISQLHSLTMRNGYNRPTNILSRHSNKQSWHASNAPIPAPMNYAMHLIDPSQIPHQCLNSSRKSNAVTGSDSGSSTGEASPPPLPSDHAVGLHGNANQTQSGSLRNKQPLNLSRLNGGKHGAGSSSSSSASNNNNVDFNNGTQPSAGALVPSNSSGNLPLLIGGQMHNFPGYRTLPQQQRQFHAQQNGELMYSFPAPYLTAQAPVVVSSGSQRTSPSAVVVPTPYPTNKMVQSCFNCGSINHTGVNCSEASMEDVTRNAVYKLDYTINAPPLGQFAAPSTMTPSASSSSLNKTMTTSTIQPANNNEPDQSITFIDLTQDTTSSSSCSSTSSIHGAK